GIVVTQYEMDAAEKVGLVKIDLLGQRSLSIVSETARSVKQNRGVRVELGGLPSSDSRTAQLLRGGRTMGCFQIESPGMRQLLQMMEAENLQQVIQALSLIRPGPSGSGMKEAFIRRKRGQEPVEYLAPQMRKVLDRTYGVMLYQEDILKVAQAVAGFSMAEGDQIRKRITKERSSGALRGMRSRFLQGAGERGVGADAAKEIWKQIESFAAYSYCKAHATTYGHISWQATYLKARWPAEFLASVIANKAGFYDARTYYEDARRLGVTLLPPSVNDSAVECRAEKPEKPGGPGAIRPGLEAVKSLSRRTIARIRAERERRRFSSFRDFCLRVGGSAEEIENLILCGAFDWTERSRPTLMVENEMLKETIGQKNVREAVRAAEAENAYSEEGQAFLFPSSSSFERDQLPGLKVPERPGFSNLERVKWELQVLGMSHSGHALDIWSGGGESGLTRSFELRRRVGESVIFAGWLVMMRRTVTKKQEYMKFLCLEDQWGVVEVVVFPDVYREYGECMDGVGVYRVEGRVKEHQGSVSLVARTVRKAPIFS
ncbi:MAG: hypothetical protein KGZ25_11230, partial [Planctomycetes bacterium]|nr:hypothetical protein [Planctomycetota bacterium]